MRKQEMQCNEKYVMSPTKQPSGSENKEAKERGLIVLSEETLVKKCWLSFSSLQEIKIVIIFFTPNVSRSSDKLDKIEYVY
jgi:hypothetical protein